MAYMNVCLPRGEGRVFDVPVWGRDTYRRFTIDKEKDAVLLRGTVDRDNPGNRHFYFFYKGQVAQIILNDDEYINDDTVKWKLVSLSVPDGLSRVEVLDELRQAVVVFGQRGMSEEEQQRWTRKFNDSQPNGFAVADF